MSCCPTCKGEMKPLFTGEFCPRDCDRGGAWDPKPEMKFKSVKFTDLRDSLLANGMFFYAPKRQVLFSNVLVEVKPMEVPKGMIFRFDETFKEIK